jgi:hypothetical protein
MVGREGFEPPKSETTGLQPAPFDRFGTYPQFSEGIIPNIPIQAKLI